jgi:hypothetical protein
MGSRPEYQREDIMNRRIASVLTAGAIAVGLAGGIGACSSSGSSSPPNATTILQNNGYTVSSDYTSALQSGIGSPSASGVSSSEAGTMGDNVQLVIVFDTSAEASAGASAINDQYAVDGINTTSNGDVVTATGTVGAFSEAGG